ncbi:uncharacterized protein LOC116259002 isoform X2 [Nymphaea colorata]|uniref:uncharacterized protein LOC116259002 isoform X2 n=1 Tax=Nymphaea colorata TaxID=210225 RepID=UPI00129E38CD|nr:uncharacterized protein LOC116259002 isoform X2 [Nymphaea colorata]
MQYRGAGGLVDPVLGFSGNENGGNAKLPPTSGAGMTSASFAVINLRASASATKKTGQFVIQLQAVSSFAAPILIISHLGTLVMQEGQPVQRERERGTRLAAEMSEQQGKENNTACHILPAGDQKTKVMKTPQLLHYCWTASPIGELSGETAAVSEKTIHP